jgi:hypothetical protein
MERLKLKDLKRMQPNTIFARGTEDKPWVAVRGDVEDWAIYKQNPYEAGEWTDEAISERGDKVHDPKDIKRLVPSTRRVYENYRH